MAAFASTAKPFIASMSTVVSIDVSGINIRDEEAVEKLIRQHVEPKVKSIIDKLKATSQKFEDPDFGPTENDPRGAISFYGTAMPAPAGSKYPKPEDLRWDRPQYDDNGMFSEGEGEKKEGEEGGVDNDDDGGNDDDDDDEEGGVWCKHGSLFLDGCSSGDVIQGQLGDCWFLGALAVMGANEQLLNKCFWRLETFKEFGIFVCRFFKDTNMIFVIVDDRIPVKEKDGKVIFAGCKDPNELWVPIIEKAYAKLHGCYKALIGGYSHYALADMTGYCPRLVVMKPGFPGYSDAMTKDDVWATLKRYQSWGCLLGTSIQSNPKENHKVEAEAGMGLHMGHAYSFVDLGTIQVDGKPVNLVKLRNPWGRGEWEGTYSDRSDEMEREEIQEELLKVMRPDTGAELGNFNDGTFYMPFDDWFERFTSLFVAINFPNDWTGKRAAGRWTGEAGGNREMTSWLSNPKLRFKLNSPKGSGPVQVFVGLYIKDSRLTMGFDYFKDPLYATPLAFDIVTKSYLESFEKPLGKEATIEKGKVVVGRPDAKPRQAPYNFGTTQIEVLLESSEEYYIVPSLYKRSVPGDYSLTVYAECDFELEGASKLGGGGGGGGGAGGGGSAVSVGEQLMPKKSDKPGAEEPTMSKTQFFEKMESLRERLVSEAQRLGLTMQNLRNVFPEPAGGRPAEELSYADFKKKLLSLGFNLTDLSDSDLQVLDANDSKTVSPKEFLAFFSLGLEMEETAKKEEAPPPPVDDLAFKATDMEGVLSVKVTEARALREAQAWFSALKDAGSADSSLPRARKLIRYDAAQRAGISARATKIAARLEADRQTLITAAAKRLAKSASNTAANANAAEAAQQQQQDLSLATTSDLFSSPIARRQGGGNTPRDDARTVRSALGDLLSSAGELAAAKLHGDKDLQEAEKRRTRDLKALRNARQSKAAEDRTAEIQESGGLRKKTALALKVHRRMLTKDRAAMALLGLDAASLRAKDWYVPHKDDGSVVVGLRADRRSAPPSMFSKIALPCGCSFTTMSVLPFIKTKNACPSCGVSFTTAPLAGDAPAALAASSSSSKPGDEMLAIQAVAVTPGNPSRGPPQFKLFKKADADVALATSNAAATPATVPSTTSASSSAPAAPADAAAAAASSASTGTISTSTGPSLASDAVAAIIVVFGVTASPGLITLVDARDNSVIVFDFNKATAADVTPEVVASALPAPVPAEVLTEGDLWDRIVDRVATISESRGRGRESSMNAAVRALEHGAGRITKDDFKAFSRVVSAIPSPSVTVKANTSKPLAAKLGTAPTPKNLKKTPGTASVTTQRNAAALHADLLSVANSDKLRALEAERYDEVFRRLVSVPTVYLNELEGERGTSTVPVAASSSGSGGSGGSGASSHLATFTRTLFDRFDSSSGSSPSITLDDFQQALVAMNIDVSADDALTLFNRFARKEDVMIDWDEFVLFFHKHIARDGASSSSSSQQQTRPISHVLTQLHEALHSVYSEMTRLRMRSVDGYQPTHAPAPAQSSLPSSTEEPFVLPDNAILHRLDESTAAANVATLRLLGITLTLEEMHRVSFVFKHDVKQLMHFAASPEVPLETATAAAAQTIIKRLKTRAGDRPAGVAYDEMTSENAARLWSLISAFTTKEGYSTCDSAVPGNALADYLEQMTLESRLATPAPVQAPATVPPTPAVVESGAAAAVTAHSTLLGGVEVELLCRVVVDDIQHSSWNRCSDGSVSFSAFEAFSREFHVASIERKLHYLLELERSLAGPATLTLAHVYVNESKTEAVILLHEPMLGTVYKMVVTEDLTALPSDPESLKLLFPWAAETKARARGSNPRVQHTLYPKILNDASFTLFNPTETPDEDTAIADLISRLRIVKGPNSSKIDADKRLILAEDPRFVQQLKKLLDSVPSLPFFCNCNDTNLYFDADRDTLAAEGSIRHLVFGHIRLYKPLHSFLVSVISDLRVVLSSYNSGVKVCMPWCEMLAHLTEYRNPYVSAELKPRFLEPHEYIYRPEDKREAFTGTEEVDALAVQRSHVVIDGGSHPIFHAQFKIQFRPPKLTSCRLVSTEIHKMEVEGEMKYVILMAREAKRDRSSERLLMRDAQGAPVFSELSSGDKQPRYHKLPDRLEPFRFLTIYDPRTATDYQCGVASGCALFDDLMEPPPDGGENETALDILKAEFDSMGPVKGGGDEQQLLSYEAVEAALCREQFEAIRQETDKKIQERTDPELKLFPFRAFLELGGKVAPELIPDDKVLQSKEELAKACKANKDLDRQLQRFLTDLGGEWVPAPVGTMVGAGATGGAPEVTGGVTPPSSAAAGSTAAATPATAQPQQQQQQQQPQRLVVKLEDSRARLFDALAKGKMGLVRDEALKRITAADTNGDGGISFVEYARMMGKQVGHASGKYDPTAGGPISEQDFMEHVEEAASHNMILLGPAITPRLLLSVVNARGKQEEILGSCQVSISSVLSGSGIGREQWVKLSHMIPNDTGPKMPDKPVPAGSVQVELGFRKQAEIDAEEQAEKDRKERRARGASSRESTPRNTPRMGAPKAVTFAAGGLGGSGADAAAAAAATAAATASASAAAAATAAAASANLALAAAKAEAERLAKQVKEESARKDELAKELAAERAKSVSSSSSGGVTGPSPELLKELEDLRALKKRMASEAEAQKSKAAADLAAQAKQIAELEKALHAQKAHVQAQAKHVHAPAPAAATSSPTAAASKDKEKDKDKDNKKSKERKSEDPLSQGLSGSNFGAGGASSGGSMAAASREAKQPAGARPSTAAPRATTVPGVGGGVALGARTGPAASSPVSAGQQKKAWVDWDAVPLPEPFDAATKAGRWERVIDKKSGKTYYVDHINKKTQWKHPQLQPTPGSSSLPSSTGGRAAREEAGGETEADEED